MNKVFLYIFIILSLFQLSYAQKFEFTQEKYINALDMITKKTAYIIVVGDDLTLKYSHENKVMHFNKNNILIKEKQNEEVLQYENNIKLFIFYNLLKAIFSDNTSFLEKDFKITKEDKITLIPKEYVRNIIKEITYKKVANKLKYIHIDFVNKDRISIVPNN